MRQTMNQWDFAPMIGTIRIAEKKLLNRAGLDRIIDASGPAEALRMLAQTTEYDVSVIEKNEEYETVLRNELKKLYVFCDGLTEHKDIIRVLGAKYDFHNIKAAYKTKLLQSMTEPPYVDVTENSPEDIAALVENRDVPEDLAARLPVHLIKAKNKADAAFASGESLGRDSAGEQGFDPQRSDILLDRECYAAMLALAEKMQNEFILKYVRHSIDFYNLKTFLRVKHMEKGRRFFSEAMAGGGHLPVNIFLENYDRPLDAVGEIFAYTYMDKATAKAMEAYERTRNFSAFEKHTDNFLVDYVKQSKYIAFGPEILFAYMVSKENEIRQVRIVLTCKINQIPAETLRERLRDQYA